MVSFSVLRRVLVVLVVGFLVSFSGSLSPVSAAIMIGKPDPNPPIPTGEGGGINSVPSVPNTPPGGTGNTGGGTSSGDPADPGKTETPPEDPPSGSDGPGHLPGTPYGPGNSDSGNTTGRGSGGVIGDGWSGNSTSPWDKNHDGYVSQDECQAALPVSYREWCLEFPSDTDIKKLQSPPGRKNQHVDQETGCLVENKDPDHPCITTTSEKRINTKGQEADFGDTVLADVASLSDGTSIFIDYSDIDKGYIHTTTKAPSGNTYTNTFFSGFTCKSLRKPSEAWYRTRFPNNPPPPLGTCYAVGGFPGTHSEYLSMEILGRDSSGVLRELIIELFDCPSFPGLQANPGYQQTFVTLEAMLSDCGIG